MDKELKKLVARLERIKRRHQWRMLWSRHVRTFGKYGRLIPSEDDDCPLIVNVVIHSFVGWAFYSITNGNLPITIAMYVAVHVLLYFVGRKLEEKNEAQLRELNVQVQAEYDSYCAKIYEAHSIVNHAYVQDGLRVTDTGMIEQKISWAGPKADIYFENNLPFRDYNALSDRKVAKNSGEIMLNKHIAYIQFNKRFVVFVDKKDERPAVIAFSPSVQLDMVKAMENDKLFQKIQLSEELLTSDLRWKLPHVDDIISIDTNVFDSEAIDKDKPLPKYFEEVPIYAEALEEKGKVALSELAQLLSALHVKAQSDSIEKNEI